MQKMIFWTWPNGIGFLYGRAWFSVENAEQGFKLFEYLCNEWMPHEWYAWFNAWLMNACKYDWEIWFECLDECPNGGLQVKNEMRRNSEGGPLVGYCKHDFPTLLVRSEIADDLNWYTCEHIWRWIGLGLECPRMLSPRRCLGQQGLLIFEDDMPQCLELWKWNSSDCDKILKRWLAPGGITSQMRMKFFNCWNYLDVKC